jgi:hypothetical protein
MGNVEGSTVRRGWRRKSSSEEEVGDLFSAVCPLSAAPTLRSQLTPPADSGIPDSTTIRRDDRPAC